MPVAEAELRPKKAQFHLKTAQTILDEVMAALGREEAHVPEPVEEHDDDRDRERHPEPGMEHPADVEPAEEPRQKEEERSGHVEPEAEPDVRCAGHR